MQVDADGARAAAGDGDLSGVSPKAAALRCTQRRADTWSLKPLLPGATASPVLRKPDDVERIVEEWNEIKIKNSIAFFKRYSSCPCIGSVFT